MRNIRWIRLAVFFVVMSLGATLWPSARAEVISATAIPSRMALSAVTAAAVNVTWRVVRDVGGPATLNSEAAFVTLSNGTDIGVAGPLARSVTGTGPFLITETVLISRPLIQQQMNLGVPGFILTREFGDGVGGVPAAVVSIRFTGSLGGTFGLNRIELQFDDSSKVRVVEQETQMYAEAIVDFTGSGLLEAVWEVADPSSTLGTAVFRQIRIVRVPLTGARRTVIRSPPLPTVRAGLHIVRLRVIRPGLVVADPQLS